MIYVTGATGFLGRHVVRALLKNGLKVRCLVYEPSHAEALADLDVEMVEGDVCDTDSLARGMRGCDQVIHLVGIIIEHRGASFEKIHIRGTANVIEAARRSKIPRVLYVSSLNAKIGSRSRYLRSKAQAEEALRASELEHVIFRPGMIFGPDDHFMFDFARKIRRWPFMAMPTGGQTKLQPVFVGDLALMIAQCAAEPPESGTAFDVGGAEVITLKAAIRRIMKAIGVRRPLLRLPNLLLWVPAWAFETLTDLPPITRDQLLMLQKDYTCDVTPLIEEFGVDLMDFDKGVEEFLVKGEKAGTE